MTTDQTQQPAAAPSTAIVAVPQSPITSLARRSVEAIFAETSNVEVAKLARGVMLFMDEMGAALLAKSTHHDGIQPHDQRSMMMVASYAHKVGIGGVKSPEEAYMRMLFGDGWGLDAPTSLALVFIVNGKPGVEAKTIVGWIQDSGAFEYFEEVEGDAKHATWRCKRKGATEEKRLTWTIDQAARAKLTDKDVWKAYPENMLTWKSAMNLARRHAAEFLRRGGKTVATLEDLRDGVVAELTDAGEIKVLDVVDAKPSDLEGKAPAAAAPPTPMESVAAGLLDRIANCAPDNADEKTAIRTEFKRCVNAGQLLPPLKDDVATAYNAKFPAPPKTAPDPVNDGIPFK